MYHNSGLFLGTSAGAAIGSLILLLIVIGVAIVLVLAPLKLYNIDKTLKLILKELKYNNSPTNTPIPPHKADRHAH